MSVHVSSWAWQQAVGDDGAKLVLLKLADSANDDGIAWPSRSTLLVECECGSEDTIKRRLRRLRELELILTVPWYDPSGRQTSSMYVLPHRGMPDADELRAMLAAVDRKGYPGNVVDITGRGAAVHPTPAGRGAAVPPSGGAPVPPSGGAAVHPSIEEPSEEPSQETLAPGKPARARRRSSSTTKPVKVDEVWDVMAELFGVVADKTNAHAKRNKAVGDLKKLGATPAAIRAAHKAWAKVFDGAAVTDVALATHYPQLVQKSGGTDGGVGRKFAAWLVGEAVHLPRSSFELALDEWAAKGVDERELANARTVRAGADAAAA